MLVLAKAGRESEALLRNLFEHYAHDMSEWFDLDVQPDGRFAFDVSKFWAGDSEVFVARDGAAIVGFAIIGPGFDMREFFVLRKYRRRGVGRGMADSIWNQRPGPWQVRVLEANRPAVPFWRAAIAAHTGGLFTEEERVVNDRRWRFFQFVVRSAQ